MPRRRPPGLTARQADPHALYEIAVQVPGVMTHFIEELFDALADRPPVLLREDFCGTANLAAHWVRSDPDRRAVAVDLDTDVLAWAQTNNRRPLEGDADRLTLVNADVMDVAKPRADVTVALNFSHFIYKTRADLLAYLRHARRGLKPGGIMILDCFGGPESFRDTIDERDFGSFVYLWEQADFDPVTHRIRCDIHFRFPNGTMLRRAFSYDWRMWSIPELSELLAEAGFGEPGVYFESEEGFTSDYSEVHPDAWVAYLVAPREAD